MSIPEIVVYSPSQDNKLHWPLNDTHTVPAMLTDTEAPPPSPGSEYRSTSPRCGVWQAGDSKVELSPLNLHTDDARLLDIQDETNESNTLAMPFTNARPLIGLSRDEQVIDSTILPLSEYSDNAPVTWDFPQSILFQSADSPVYPTPRVYYNPLHPSTPSSSSPSSLSFALGIIPAATHSQSRDHDDDASPDSDSDSAAEQSPTLSNHPDQSPDAQIRTQSGTRTPPRNFVFVAESGMKKKKPMLAPDSTRGRHRRHRSQPHSTSGTASPTLGSSSRNSSGSGSDRTMSVPPLPRKRPRALPM